MIPQLERALIAGHDVVLLGERGQGKTRLLRTLVGLLDEWTPVISGSELGEHPYDPITHASKAAVASYGDDLRISWRHRDERYAEKLATPDTSVADLIGDVDPMKVAEGRSLGDPETIHFGLIPRSHRGIVAINELPDLAERIQVSMLNVMEERDVQIRGYVLRLPLDVLVVASANPEDYTNRGRIITPLKDRFGAEIRTHYPTELEAEVAVVRQEAHLVAELPDYLVEILARFTRNLRESSLGRPALRRVRPVRDRGRRDHRRRRPAPGDGPGRGRGGGPGGRPRDRRRRARRQDRVRDRRGGPRAGDPHPPAPHRDRRDRPRPLPRPRLRAAGRGHRGGRDGHHRRAGHRPRLPRRAAGARASPSSTTTCATASAPPTTASAPARSSSRWRASTSPARSARTPTGRETVYRRRIARPAPASAATTAATRSRRRSTSPRRWTRSART